MRPKLLFQVVLHSYQVYFRKMAFKSTESIKFVSEQSILVAMASTQQVYGGIVKKSLQRRQEIGNFR